MDPYYAIYAYTSSMFQLRLFTLNKLLSIVDNLTFLLAMQGFHPSNFITSINCTVLDKKGQASGVFSLISPFFLS